MFCQMFAAKVFGLNFLLHCPPRSRRLHLTSKGLAQWRLHKGSGGVVTSKFALPLLRANAAIAPNPS